MRVYNDNDTDNDTDCSSVVGSYGEHCSCSVHEPHYAAKNRARGEG